jgi:hypothetical protein
MSIDVNVADIISSIGLWPLLVIVVVCWGIAPTLIVRLASMLYPREDPRRQEMVAEMHAVPRRERPLWALEEATRAIWDGVPERIRIFRGGVRTGAFVIASSSLVAPAFMRGKFDDDAHDPHDHALIVWAGDPRGRTAIPLASVRTNGAEEGLTVKVFRSAGGQAGFFASGNHLFFRWRRETILVDLGETALQDRFVAGQPVRGRWYGKFRRKGATQAEIERGALAVANWCPDPYSAHRSLFKPSSQRPLQSTRVRTPWDSEVI